MLVFVVVGVVFAVAANVFVAVIDVVVRVYLSALTKSKTCLS